MKTGPLSGLALNGCISRPTDAEFRSGRSGSREPQASAPGLHERTADREPEAEPFRLRAAERLEQGLGDIRGNARSIVAHAHLDFPGFGRDSDVNEPAAGADGRERIEAV